MLCHQCHTPINEYPCPYCESGPPKGRSNVWKENAEFFGFTDAKALHETRNAWKKVGG